jgi:hypothetical protein
MGKPEASTVVIERAGDGVAMVAAPVVRDVLGHVACARGAHGDGAHGDVDSLAIWHVSAEGIPSGAWVWPWPAEAAEARRAFGLIDGRLVVDVDPTAAIDVVADLIELAGLAAPSDARQQWQTTTPGQLLQEVTAFHAELERAYDEAASVGSSKLVPLNLSSLPDVLVGDLAAQSAALGLRLPSDVSPVVARALGTANVISALIRLWQDAERQRMRRSYLRSSGETRPLSTEWLAALRRAAAQSVLTAEVAGTD